MDPEIEIVWTHATFPGGVRHYGGLTLSDPAGPSPVQLRERRVRVRARKPKLTEREISGVLARQSRLKLTNPALAAAVGLTKTRLLRLLQPSSPPTDDERRRLADFAAGQGPAPPPPEHPASQRPSVSGKTGHHSRRTRWN